MNKFVLEAGHTIWRWLPENDDLYAANLLFVLGSDAKDVPVAAASIYQKVAVDQVVVAGGYGRLSGGETDTEASIYGRLMVQHGVPRERILLEERSSNTGENITFSKQLLLTQNLLPQTGILVTTPWLSRRQKATLQKQWSDVTWLVSAPQPQSFEILVKDTDFLHLLVGEVERLEKYPARGFTVPVEIPEPVLAAKQALITAGCTRFLVQ